jgi:iron complex outermembrane receptor protein
MTSLALATSFLLAAAPAQAAAPVAPAEPAADQGTSPVVDDIVITARRRSENVQDVPLAVSVVDSRTLESTGSFNVARLTQLQPSLQFYSTNPRNSAANIRGLGAPFGLTNDGIEQGVGVYIDQVYNSRIAAATFDFLDVEQVEVLRGPQGTLYGKNTTAGAINITTRAPSFTFEGGPRSRSAIWTMSRPRPRSPVRWSTT